MCPCVTAWGEQGCPLSGWPWGQALWAAASEPPPPAGAGTGDILVTRLAFRPGAVCKVSLGGLGCPHGCPGPSVQDHTLVGLRSAWLPGWLGRQAAVLRVREQVRLWDSRN